MGLDDWSTPRRDDRADVAADVRRWADSASDSALYRSFALAISEDPAMLDVVARIPGVPPMNLLLGAVKLTLTPADPLAAWYPHLTPDARPADAAAYAAFRTHVGERADALVAEASGRRTQTNEVARAAILVPWLTAFAGDEPIHAIDLGASAGLNLCLDRFAYRYAMVDVDGAREVAFGASPVTLTTDWRGPGTPASVAPVFASRTGIDLHPVDPTDPDATAWLEALVWPEHTDRLERLRAAMELRRETDVTMVEGDAARELVRVARALPPGPLAIWHTVALYQAPPEVNALIDEAVADVARDRRVLRIGVEPVRGMPDMQVRVGPSYEDGVTVATAHHHGRWVSPVPF